MPVQSHVAISADGVPIHYDVQGTGATALVFVHGWCCNRHFWDRQVGDFALHYTIVSLDLAGHGASGRDRLQWTVAAFAQDIVAVVEQLGLEQVVLIGHSIGGQWIVEAARRLPRSVIGVVGVDTWPNVAQPLSPAQVAETLAPFHTNFVDAMRTFARNLFVPTSDPALVEHVVATMSAAPPPMAIGVREEGLGNVRGLQAGLQEVAAPKITINAESWRPTNQEVMDHYGVEVMRMFGVGHFVMLEDPQTFNRLLNEAVQQCLHVRARQWKQPHRGIHFAAISICKHGLSISAHWLPVWKIQAFPARYFWECACRDTVLIGNLPSRYFSLCVGCQYWLWSYAYGSLFASRMREEGASWRRTPLHTDQLQSTTQSDKWSVHLCNPTLP